MEYKEVLNTLESFQRFGPRPGLERMKKLMDRLGNPQHTMKFVHVAGTNGKGTTCALTASVLRKAGYRTGLYLSPHLEDFRERMQINGELIPRKDLVWAAETVFPRVREMTAQGDVLTEFEVITAMAFCWFAVQKCEIVVLEVGLGGRLDATNVIGTPLVSVITSISLDHTKILGNTLAEIAAEKCGIIKPDGVTVCYPDQKPQAFAVIRQAARERGNRWVPAEAVTVLSPDITGSALEIEGKRLWLPFAGEHQIKNAETVLTILKALREQGYPVSEEAVGEGFAEVQFPARLEVLSREPLVLLDGAHNPDGTAALARTLRSCLPGKAMVAVTGMLGDKDVWDAVKNLAGLFRHVITVAPAAPRAMDALSLADVWRSVGDEALAAEDYEEALFLAERLREPDGAVVICGSLYLAGDLRGPALRRWDNKKE